MHDKPRLLDLFCGAGGAAMGYSQAGFEVVGVDIKPQPRYPFAFIQTDALEYVKEHGPKYDAIHASPPCQAFSKAFSQLLGKRKEHPDLLTPTRALLLQIDSPFVIENVPGAPMSNYIKLNGTMFGLKTKKERWFELHGFEIWMTPTSWQTHGMLKSGRLVGIVQHSYYSDEIRPTASALADAYGIDWGLSRYELRQAIPPAYTEFIGKQLLQVVNHAR